MTLCRRRGAARLIEGDILVAWRMWRSTVAFWISCRPFYCSCSADGAVRSYRRSRRSRPPPLMCWTRPTRYGHKGWRLRVHYILPQGRMFLHSTDAASSRAAPSHFSRQADGADAFAKFAREHVRQLMVCILYTSTFARKTSGVR